MANALRLLVAFEGGGAKGIAHVGALKALEEALASAEPGSRVVGVAGTSAGAIVAALAAAGFRADDLIDPVRRTTCLGSTRPGAALAGRLFGRAGWRAISAFRRTVDGLGAWLSWHRRPVVLALLGLVALSVVAAFGLPVALLAYLVASLAGLALLLWAGRRLLGGLASLDTFRDGLGTLLAEKVGPADGVVRFRDFGDATGRPTLKIVATDISTRQRHVFSPETTPAAVVADAVAASACLPLVFAPRTVSGDAAGCLYVDGGFVSNLPVWLFDVERTLDPDAITIAVGIEDKAAGEPPPTRYTWLPSLARTAIFGRNFLNTRGVGRLRPVVLPAPIGVLDFDVDEDRTFDLVQIGAETARVRIRTDLFDIPRIYRQACEAVRTLFLGILDELPPALMAPVAGPRHVRVAVALPEQTVHATGIDGEPRYLRLQHSAGYDGFADDGLTLPIEGSIMGAVWGSRTGASQLMLTKVRRNGAVHDVVSRKYSLPGPQNRARRSLVWRDLAWVLAVPMSYDENGTVKNLVISIDGNDVVMVAGAGGPETPTEDPLEIDPGLESIMTGLAAETRAIFHRALRELER
ncbi:patatin-like phospholipase family protein [Rhodoplanes sp. TEM]|uniref:Patatin-like phospholipase family protein n=1 Tax=Rhodoplanes tepidamans TaxID=200616 RepID=A0ABT5J642_RHOTP|nr:MULTISPECIES: patatin-like phospholipase family protein [Rhodoplanes]MDC7784851.1 patatin-like phospholipase family protein [Rhodoplanes tepidamans]MDC7988102.1 patatin-like phospholipase family protein [Rhodoplanes sp. TEM]MDQ0353922.1 NTE family protein [Rhodoplanes tepidamans]